MKTAKPPQVDAGPSSSRRAQPVRQTRANPPRASSGPGRILSARDSLGASHGHDQPIDVFPAVTYFTDAITSLPKDLVRHFTLLKEVDAKIFAPEETLFQLVNAVLKSRPPEPRNANDASSSVAAASTPMSTQNSPSGFPTNGNPPGSTDDNYNSPAFDPSNLPRRQLFRQTAFKVQEMLVSLEEKNHVISTANEALSKQLARINDVWPHLEAEFSDEAKWGSNTHWAYPENRLNRANQTERSRRDGAATITAAAQQLADEAAARSDARKQAIIAKKGLKNQHQDSDVDDHEGKHKGESMKKAPNNGHSNSKARRTAENTIPVGLGITAGAVTNSSAATTTLITTPGTAASTLTTNNNSTHNTIVTSTPTATPTTNGNPPSKRRKVEANKPVNGGQPMERAISSVFGSNASKTNKNSSPRATPAPELPKKRKALPTVNGASKKSKTTVTAAAAAAAATFSPPIAASPTQPIFGDQKAVGRGSPAPSTTSVRPTSSRARQNSIQSNVDTGRQRPTSSASNRPNGTAPATQELSTTHNGIRPPPETKTSKETVPLVKVEASKEEAVHTIASASITAGNNKKETVAKGDDVEPKVDSVPVQPTTTTTVVTTKSGRASKPSTPALGSFPDPPARSRSSRTTTTTTTNAKRSHKKGAAQQVAARVADEDANSSVQGDDEGDADADEPLYCYCNGVSYGEMVACDAEDCEREWFHLDCVGLKAAPPSNMKWYCDNCKDRIRTGKRVNGR
ncbi:hypothetical protein GGS23DRAFT_334325 [Durotheca rogersii]|uniref:uncharacterized protein n=1 Tax=Durotheca rogersii TaxID=419775 RepID=UPI0022205B46|nr:uncharacterized protein GGS23DRAFT_334325 [Durotheca rogersii]KAI5858302.1 hypothetical protein GGS23DRAFT_334325 [Durotheca rogersii]